MSRVQAVEVRPQGPRVLLADELGYKVFEQSRVGPVTTQYRQTPRSVAGGKDSAGPSTEAFETSPAPPSELLEAVDGDQIPWAEALQPSPVLMLQVPMLAVQADALNLPALGLQALFEIFEQGSLAATLRPHQGSAEVEPRQACEELFPAFVQSIT